MSGEKLDFQKWVDGLMEVQLEIEEMSVDELRHRAQEISRGSEQRQLSRDDLITLTMMVFAAIKRSPTLPYEHADDLQEAWIEGIGVPREELLGELRKILRKGGA